MYRQTLEEGRDHRLQRPPRQPLAALRAMMLGVLVLCSAGSLAGSAKALPSFAQQTGQPCSQCHVGAYGPQLKPYGRDFKLFGYVNGDTKNNLPPITVIATGAYTRNNADRVALPHYGRNDNLAVQNLTLAYAGKLFGGAGAFAEMAYDGVLHTLTLTTIDVKRSFNPTIAGKDVVLGVDVNNRPGAQDMWNSTPVFEFVPMTSQFAALPAASPLIDGKPGQLATRVVGLGGYAMWDEQLYTEFTAYTPIDNNSWRRAGFRTPATADIYEGEIPYWRVALQHQFGKTHYAEIGGYGLQAHRFPGGVRRFGTDQITDTAADATYQYTASRDHYVSAHATWIHEDYQLDASHQLTRTNTSDRLDTMRADAIYSYRETWTPAVAIFKSFGSTDPKFFKTGTGAPNSEGYVLELSYAPWGKLNSSFLWGNARVAVRWVGYAKFNGQKAHASNNDTLYLTTKVALAPFGAFVKR